jgi:hypothetical protein
MNRSARRINALARGLGAGRYLEIGVESGVTFLGVEIAHKTAVDPNFLLDTQGLAGEKTRFHAETSDRFFAERHDGGVFDIVFIDGLHVFEQVVRDLHNALLNSHAGSVIILDDTWPSDVFSAIRDYQETMRFRAAAGLAGDDWHGDAYKAVFYIHDFWPGLNYATIVGAENPQTLVWRSNTFVRRPLFDSLERVSRLDYFDMVRNRDVMRERTEEEALAMCLGEVGRGAA